VARRASAKHYSDSAAGDPLAGFSRATRDWFAASFAEPTAAQALGWPAIAGGAPTQVEPGTSEISVTVNLSYEIR